MANIDNIDRQILRCLEVDGGLSQREVAERVGLSQNACWRRIQRLTQAGILGRPAARLDARALGLSLTVFVMVRTRHHTAEWSAALRAHVATIPEVAEMHRIGGEWDYLLKVITRDMAGYDLVYQRLISGIDLENVTGFFSMETILDGRPLALDAVP